MNRNANISSEILLHTRSQTGDREVLTFLLRLPRFIHAELLTHRKFARNAASSRAIPQERMHCRILANTATFEQWGTNNSGMQSNGLLDADKAAEVKAAWDEMARQAVHVSQVLTERFGLHKQIVNRNTEPFSHIEVLVTTSDIRNFFALRAHHMAQPEFQVLAYMMLQQYLASEPTRLNEGEWHIPFAAHMPEGATLAERLAIATGRSARLSYATQDGNHSPEADVKLHDRLKESGHWSPFEHCVRYVEGSPSNSCMGPGLHTYRSTFPSECQTPSDSDLENLLAAAPEWVLEAIERNHNS